MIEPIAMDNHYAYIYALRERCIIGIDQDKKGKKKKKKMKKKTDIGKSSLIKQQRKKNWIFCRTFINDKVGLSKTTNKQNKTKMKWNEMKIHLAN